MKRKVISLGCFLLLSCTLLWAVVAFVNGAIGSVDTPTGTTIASAAANHTSGNLLSVFVSGSGSPTVTSVTDTAGNTYAQCTSARATGTAGFSDIWYAKNITGNASNVVTANLSANSDFRRITIGQYSGVDTTAPMETGGNANQATGTSVTSSSFSPAAANNVNVAGASTAAGGTFTAGTNYTLRTAANTDNQTESRIGAPSGAQTASITYPSGAVVFSVCSYKQAGGVATPCQDLSSNGMGC